MNLGNNKLAKFDGQVIRDISATFWEVMAHLGALLVADLQLKELFKTPEPYQCVRFISNFHYR